MSAFPQGLAGRLSLAVTVQALTAAAPARADFVTFQFEGVITRSTSPLVGEGDRFTGTFTYDLGAIDEAPDEPQVGFYTFELPKARPVGMSYTAGLFSHSSQFYFEVLVINDSEAFGDSLLVGSDDLFGPGFFPPYGIVYLEDDTQTVFSSDRPPSTLDFSRFSIREFEGSDGNLGSSFVGEIQSLMVVPEPGTLTLIGLGAVLLLGGRCLRRRTAPA
jgi:hypothetical protein